MRLFDLSEKILELEAELEDESLSNEQRDTLVDQWLEAQGDASEKIDNYAAWICEMEARIEARAFHAERLRSLAKADQYKADRRREGLQKYFERHNIERFKTARFNLSLQGNGGVRPIIVDIAPENLPEQYQVRHYEANKSALREKLQQIEAAILEAKERFEIGQTDEGQYYSELAAIEHIPGVRLGERGTSLRIR